MKVLASTIFGAMLLLVGACSQNNGAVSASSENENVESATLIAESSGYRIRRYVDCSAQVVVYSQANAISVISANVVSADFMRQECGNF